MKRVWIATAVVGAAALLVAVALTVIEGLEYRDREERGLDPVYAPDWVVASTHVGLAVFACAAAVLAIAAVVAALRRRRLAEQARG